MNDESGALPPRPVADDYRTRDGYISLSFHDAMRAWRQAADALIKVQQEQARRKGGGR